MCRWIFYYGEEVCISKLIYGASHGLATMADRAGWTPGCERDVERNHEVNVHGRWCVKTTMTTRGEEDATAVRGVSRGTGGASSRLRALERDDDDETTRAGSRTKKGRRRRFGASRRATDSDSSRFPREGIGWYAACRCGMVDRHGLDAYCRPAVYTTVAAPSHDRNLRSLSKSLNGVLLFGHVRAAGPGASVHQYNCHPFVRGRYMFMHNGDVADLNGFGGVC